MSNVNAGSFVYFYEFQGFAFKCFHVDMLVWTKWRLRGGDHAFNAEGDRRKRLLTRLEKPVK